MAIFLRGLESVNVLHLAAIESVEIPETLDPVCLALWVYFFYISSMTSLVHAVQ